MKVEVFIESEVLLDLLTERKLFVDNAVRIIQLATEGAILASTTPLVIANIYYILKKDFSHKSILIKFNELLSVVDIVNMNKRSVMEALNSDFTDFEDALQNFSLKNTDIQTIITRNIKDYKNSEFNVLTPSEFLESLP